MNAIHKWQGSVSHRAVYLDGRKRAMSSQRSSISPSSIPNLTESTTSGGCPQRA
jgi:hypothetical protein